MKTPMLPLFTSDFEARADQRRAERVQDCLLRIHEAADSLSFGLDSPTAPAQLDQIELAVECLRADLRILAD